MGLALGAVVVAIVAWWLATGAVIMIARRFSAHPLYLLLPSAAVAIAGIALALSTASSLSIGAVYGAFFAALLIWGFHEVTFLMGYVVGPRRVPCPPHAMGRDRFGLAFAAIRDHEIALFVTGLVLAALLFGAANPFAVLIYALMWITRLFTKFNVFLGAPNAVSEVLPQRMAYLTSYFRTDRVHPFFIISVTIVTSLLTACVYMAASATDPGMVTGWSLMAAFAFLGLIEHLFLVLPVRDAALWGWAMGANGQGRIRLPGAEAPGGKPQTQEKTGCGKPTASALS